jgi:hypothetical protein
MPFRVGSLPGRLVAKIAARAELKRQHGLDRSAWRTIFLQTTAFALQQTR